MRKIMITIGTRTVISRGLRSFSFSFLGFVIFPNMTR